jgi:hypothetical protein
MEEQLLEQQEQPLRRSSRVQAQVAQSSQVAIASPSQPQSSSCVPRTPRVRHFDLTTCSSKTIKKLKTVPLEEWFPLQRQHGVEYFCTAIQEDFFRTYHERGRFTAQRVISVENFVRVLGVEFR